MCGAATAVRSPFDVPQDERTAWAMVMHWSTCGEYGGLGREIPAFAGMTCGGGVALGEGMTFGGRGVTGKWGHWLGREIPAFAGMTCGGGVALGVGRDWEVGILAGAGARDSRLRGNDVWGGWRWGRGVTGKWGYWLGLGREIPAFAGMTCGGGGGVGGGSGIWGGYGAWGRGRRG